jgi:hypothetical protein
MSHIHNISGNLNAAADYRDYLTLRAGVRKPRRDAEGEEESEVRTFDSAIETPRDSQQDPGGGPEHEAAKDSGEEPGPEPDGGQGFSVKA